MNKPLCVFEILDVLGEEIKKDTWVNHASQVAVLQGVNLAKARLQNKGFIRVSDTGLAVKPITSLGRSIVGEHANISN